MHLHLAFSALLLAALTCANQAAEDRPYLRSGTAQVGGVRHLCLIYHGQQSRVPWTPRALMPYVCYVDEHGHPRDWLFDSFLFIEFATDEGASLHHYRAQARQPSADDWTWLADCWFRPNTGLTGLEQAMAESAPLLGDPERRVKVVISMPIPLAQLRDFGPLEREHQPLDFGLEQHRQQALAWYVNRVLDHWSEHDFAHLELVGFYWLAETIGPADHDLVRWTVDHLHQRGYRLYWIPYFGAQGVEGWRELGIDAVMLQPNYFFRENAPLYRLLSAARRAYRAGTGIEIEFDARALSDPAFEDKFYAYLDAAIMYGWTDDVLLGYYEGGGALKMFADTPGRGRELYDALYRFAKGSYVPSGRHDFSQISEVLIDRDNSGNLALASRGAIIHGCVRPDNQPELAPEKIIDGDIFGYGGMHGYGYFTWPGGFTVELPKPSTVARTQTMLHDSANQFFRYRIETSMDNQNWEIVVEKSEGEWRGWQVDSFTPRQARYIRFTGLHNSANQNFQVIEFEVYSEPQ